MLWGNGSFCFCTSCVYLILGRDFSISLRSWADFPGRLNQARKNAESPRVGCLLSRINLGCCLGESFLCRCCFDRTCLTCICIASACRLCLCGSSTTSCRRTHPPWVSWTPTPVARWICSCPWLSRIGGGEHLSRTAVFPCVRSARGRAPWWVSPLSCTLITVADHQVNS